MENNEKNAEFLGNYILRGKFKCLTGLHIGGSKEKMEIGGVDSPVVRDPRTRFPYVPGSSLKGKLRSLLEYGLGAVPPTGEVSANTEIVRLFGIGADVKEPKESTLHKIGPSRLVVRDCHPDDETKKWWKTMDTDLLYTEYKSENGINRITSAANPRFIERVAAGSQFEFEFVYSVYDITRDDSYKNDVEEDLGNLRMALLMLEHNFLGKSGSRGYGRVEFSFESPVWVSKQDYQSGGAKFAALQVSPKPVHAVGDLKWEISELKASN